MSMISSYTDYSIALWNGWRSGLNDSWLESITLLYPATARREYNSMPDSGHPRLWSNRTHTQTRSSRAHAPRPNTVNTHTHTPAETRRHTPNRWCDALSCAQCVHQEDRRLAGPLQGMAAPMRLVVDSYRVALALADATNTFANVIQQKPFQLYVKTVYDLISNHVLVAVKIIKKTVAQS